LVNRLQWLDAHELDELLHRFNDTAVKCEPQCIHQMFEAQMSRTPDAPALVFEDAVLSYAELNAQANQLAHHLITLGVQPDTRVAIALPRGIHIVVAVLATLKAGGAYVPLDPDYPAERLAFMLADSAPRVLLTASGLDQTLGDLPTSLAVLQLDAPARAWDGLPAISIKPASLGLTPQHLAYVIYTSGSTGTPKAVMIEHRNAVNFIHWGARSCTPAVLQRTLWSTSLNFDLAVFECFVPLSCGATVHLVPDALALTQRQEDVTLINTVPSAMAALLDAQSVPATVRQVQLAGEPLQQQLVQRIFAHTGADTICNLYGPTETTTYSTGITMSREDGFKPSIGRPIDNTRIYILDAQGHPVPIGVAGEIHIGGAGVARGYLNRPELTLDRFMPDPFGEPGSRMYKTSDVARWRPDGSIEFLGRSDHQVKIRGFRIELGEIEAALQACTGVREAVVLARGHGAEKQLVAYTTGDAAPQALREALAARLPSHMVPAAYVLMDALPLTPNGKLDRQALHDPQTGDFGQRAYEAPQGEVEEALAEIWRDLLGVPQVGRHDHFFELGGHSLLAVQLIERMRRLHWELPVRALFASPTLATLAQEVHRQAGVVVPANPITAQTERITPQMLPLAQLTQPEIDQVVVTVVGGTANVQDIYALAPLQRGMVFHHLVQQQGDAYLNAAVLAFDSRERLQRYLQALQSVIHRHDILRTALVWQGLREPVQVVWRQAELPVQELEIQAEDVAAELWARLAPHHTRIELDRAPLLRAHAAQDPKRGRWLLHLLYHHAVMDHTTLELLTEELQAYMGGQEHLLPEPVPFRNFVAQAREVSEQAHEQYFREQLGDVHEPTAPYGLMDVHGDGSRSYEEHVPLPLSLAQSIRQQARLRGVSAASVFHLAWALVVARTSARRDVVFGTVLFGRMQGGQGAQRAVGMFLNTLPLRVKLGGRDAGQALQHTHDALARLLQHEHASLALAQRASAVAHPAPLFTALLNYRYAGGSKQLAGQLESDGPQGVEMLHSQERTNYPVTLSVNDEPGSGFSLDVQVNPPVAPHQLARQMMHALRQIVQALQSNAQTPLVALTPLPAEEAQQLASFNRTQQSYPGGCIHELFEVQAARTPDAVALEYEGQQLTYARLEARANQLARHLKKLGVGADRRVAIALPRSLEMVVALLATLKAAGAYVPLDPAYPAERLKYMLQDSDPVVVLSTEALAQSLPLHGQALCCLEGPQPPWAAEPETALGEPVRRHDAAYVIYTSGSTGQPKGVVVEHQQVVRLLKATERDYGFGPQDTWTLFHSYAFDFSVWEMWGALAYGGKLVVVPQEVTRSPHDFYELLCAQGVTVLNQTPSAFRQLMTAQAASQRQHKLRYVIFGGEALEPAWLRPWFERNPQQPTLVNMYGITETTVHVTYRPLSPADAQRPGSSPIGHRLSDMRVYILDEQGHEVPIGVAGELYVGGQGVARGYLHRPGLTAQRFVADPYSGEPGARMYRTGDLGRWREDGTIEYLGRNDHQVKVRGFRIELGEIEAALRTHAEVRDAVVLPRGEALGDQRLVAYVIGVATPEALRAHLGSRLPEYMVPAAYVALDALPLTPNGKLDREALPAPDGSAFGAHAHEPPQGDIETTLAHIWRELLGLERIGRHDDFFLLGGHSLLAMQLVVRVKSVFDVDFEIRSVFDAATLSDMAWQIAYAKLNEFDPDDLAELLQD
jgi:amino acid adenylation domain-containing protein